MIEFLRKVEDFFTPSELVEYLVDGGFMEYNDLVHLLRDELEDAREDVEELMGARDGES